MKQLTITLLGLAAIFGIALAETPKPVKLTITTGQDDSVLYEHRRVGKGADDFAKKYDAAKISGQQLPVEVVKNFEVDDRPLLWFNAAKDAVVCDQAVFPNGLTVVEATKMDAGESESPGVITPAAFEALGMQRMAEFLIRSCAVQTWIHIESTLQLTELSPSSASFRGSHLYFTNQENNDPLAFTIIVDDSGKIIVTGDKLD